MIECNHDVQNVDKVFLALKMVHIAPENVSQLVIIGMTGPCSALHGQYYMGVSLLSYLFRITIYPSSSYSSTAHISFRFTERVPL